MKTTKQIEIPARTETVTDFVACDICGAHSKGKSADDWLNESYTVSGTEVSMHEGTNYPEGGDVTETRFDICPPCFKDVLVPLIKGLANSTGPSVIENDW